ncbi:MAG: DUF4229 domain-containing protein [Nocardioidaceae bacterium]|nr:DUF4229 domain-containing protein [Nocardioidaceae bacterium]
MLRYTLARLALFAAAFGLVWLVGGAWLVWDQVSVLWTALVALALSAVASFVLLRGMRAELAERLHGGAARMSDRLDESRRSEDV